MSLIVRVELSRKEIARFRRIMREAADVTEHLSRDEVIRGARNLVEQLRDDPTPGFVLNRIGVVEKLIEMTEDPHWRRSPGADRRMLDALVGYCEPVRFLRRSPRGPSYLDDAVIIELMRNEFQDEIRAYDAKQGLEDSGGGIGSPQAAWRIWLAGVARSLKGRLR